MINQDLVKFMDEYGLDKTAEVMGVTARTVEGYLAGRSVPEARIGTLNEHSEDTTKEVNELKEDLKRLKYRYKAHDRGIAQMLGVPLANVLKGDFTAEKQEFLAALLGSTTRVRKLRQKMEIDAKEFAIFFGVSEKTIERWEKGARMNNKSLWKLGVLWNQEKY